MKLDNPQKAEGFMIRWCRWEKDHSFLVTKVNNSGTSRQIKGTLYDKHGTHEYRSYNLIKGITTGEIIEDHWYILDWSDYSLEDELFEI